MMCCVLACNTAPRDTANTAPSASQEPRSTSPRTFEGCVETEPWYPFSYHDETHPDERTGATVELVREASSRLGITLHITERPWTRCMHMVKDGRYVFTLDASPNEKRLRDFVFGEPLYALDQVMYSMQGASPSKTASNLSELRVCGLMGYNYEGLLFRHEQLDATARTVHVMFDKLRAGRCDVALGYAVPYAEAARHGRLDLTGIKGHPIPGAHRRRWGVMANRSERGRGLVAALDGAMREMRADGTYLAILERFGVESRAIMEPTAGEADGLK